MEPLQIDGKLLLELKEIKRRGAFRSLSDTIKYLVNTERSLVNHMRKRANAFEREQKKIKPGSIESL